MHAFRIRIRIRRCKHALSLRSSAGSGMLPECSRSPGSVPNGRSEGPRVSIHEPETTVGEPRSITPDDIGPIYGEAGQ
jgi:hypothetical protein